MGTAAQPSSSTRPVTSLVPKITRRDTGRCRRKRYVPCTPSQADWRNPKASANGTDTQVKAVRKVVPTKGTSNGPSRISGIHENHPMPMRLLTRARYSATATAAMPQVSRSSLIASALIIGLVSGGKWQRPSGAARVLDERIFQVQLRNLQPRGRQRFQGRPLPGTKTDEHQLQPGADLPGADQALQGRHRRRLPAKLQVDFAHRVFEVLDRTIHAQDALDHD